MDNYSRRILAWRVGERFEIASTVAVLWFADNGAAMVRIWALFMDLGAGTVVAGVTSGGLSGPCLPPAYSFDANVFFSLAFINSIGGADLANTSCGISNQVGDGGDTVDIRFSSLVPSKAAAKCRKEIRKQYTKYATSILKSQQSCLDNVGSGAIDGPCPDSQTNDRIAAAAAKVDGDRIGKKCSPSVISTVGAALGCAAAAYGDDLESCVLAASDAAVAALLDVQYADLAATTAPAESSDADCQAGIGKAMGKYTEALLKGITRCQAGDDAGKTDTDTCPDTKTASKLSKAELKVVDALDRACSDGDVASLDTAATFGGTCAGVVDVDGYRDCALIEHEQISRDLTGLFTDPTASLFEFTIPGFINSDMIVTLNGIDDGINDVDLYLRAGSPPTTSIFDESSESSGTFESIVVPTPPSGTYYVLVDDVPEKKRVVSVDGDFVRRLIRWVKP